MSRFLRRAPGAAAVAGPAGPPLGLGPYLERAAKYVPVEVIGPFAWLQGLFAGAPADAPTRVALGAAFGLALLSIPLYVRATAEPGDAVRAHVLVGLAAFPVWVYASAVTPTVFGLYDPRVAAAALFAFTLSSGLVRPR